MAPQCRLVAASPIDAMSLGQGSAGARVHDDRSAVPAEAFGTAGLGPAALELLHEISGQLEGEPLGPLMQLHSSHCNRPPDT